jgi:hypothetical protein
LLVLDFLLLSLFYFLFFILFFMFGCSFDPPFLIVYLVKLFCFGYSVKVI